jgi:hypothetical protein
MNLHGYGPTPWTWGVCALPSALTCGLAVGAGNWSNAISQVLVIMWIWTAHYWRTKANTPAQGAHQ